MKRKMISVHHLRALLVAGICLLITAPAHADETILIIRHGEKPPMGLGQLNCRGLNRALALPDVLLPHYGKPTAIFAPNPAIKKTDKGAPYAYVRPLATIEPLAIRLGMPVNIDWGMAEIAPLARHLLARNDGTYIVAWEHHYGEDLARLLLEQLHDNTEVPPWKASDFDSIYVIRIAYVKDGQRRVMFTVEKEGLNGLSETCPHN
jgi:hypothetical protein